MIILGLRTDKPQAEIYLFEGEQKKSELKWEADRQLAETIHKKIKEILKQPGVSWKDIQAVVVFSGPGSFTGLRIGISTANALAYANSIPIIGTKGKDWLEQGIKKIKAGQNDKIVVPFYGSPPKTTKPKK